VDRRDNNVMHAKPDLRVFLKWMIAGSGSVIVVIIWLRGFYEISSSRHLHCNELDIRLQRVTEQYRSPK
jgi:hypothetical protein